MRFARFSTVAALMIFGVMLAACASAQTYWVQSADWGVGNQRHDVTATVRRLVNGPNFKANNQNLGVDPAKGKDKTLRIVARDSNGRVRDFTYNEGATVSSSIFRGSAWNGGASTNGNWWVQSADWGAGNRRQDVTATVRRLVDGPNFTANNRNLGVDPAKGADKTLRITARDASGKVRDFSYKEGATVNSSMFRGGAWNGRPGTPVSGALRITQAKWGFGAAMVDVTSRLQSMVRNNRLTVVVTPQTMGSDPSPGNNKLLSVFYTYGGKQSTKVVVENGTLDIP